MTVGRICTRCVDLAEFGDSVQTVAQRMHQRKVGSLLVLDEQRRPAGIITDRDLVVRVLAEGRDPQQTAVEEVMTVAPRTVPENASVEVALSLMRQGGFRRVPVVNAEGSLAGLVTLDDVLNLLVDEMKDIGRVLEQESPASLAR